MKTELSLENHWFLLLGVNNSNYALLDDTYRLSKAFVEKMKRKQRKQKSNRPYVKKKSLSKTICLNKRKTLLIPLSTNYKIQNKV